MTKEKEALRLALEALECLLPSAWEINEDVGVDADKAITAIKEVLAQPERKPLSDDEIKRIWGSYFSRGMEFARAIERAHGIKEDA